MQHCTRHVVHLVELVDTADALVAQHQRAALQNQIAAFVVLTLTVSPHPHLAHIRRQTHRRRALARGVDAARRDLVHAGEELRLGGAGVAAEQDVDVGAEVAVVVALRVRRPAEQHAQQTLLHVLHSPMRHGATTHTPDGRRDGGGELLVNGGIP